MVKNGKKWKIVIALCAIVLTFVFGAVPAFAQPAYFDPSAPAFSRDTGDNLQTALAPTTVFPNRLNRKSILWYANAVEESLKWYSSFGYVFTDYVSVSGGIEYRYYNVTEWTPLVIYEIDLGALTSLTDPDNAIQGYAYVALVTSGEVTARNWTNTSFTPTDMQGVSYTNMTWNEQVVILDYGGHEGSGGDSFTALRAHWPAENSNATGYGLFGKVVYNFNSSFGQVGLVQANIAEDGVDGFADLYDKWHNASLGFDGDLTGGGASEEELQQAYQNGYNAGLTAGDQQGYSRGYDDGYEEGEDYGYSQGLTAGDQQGYSRGYDDGYEEGEDYGFRTGYSDGHDEGYDQGYSTGYSTGYASGEETGYNDGYRAGFSQTPVDMDVDSVINSFFSGVHSIFNGWFDVEVFGISIAGTLIGILVICIVAFVVKKLV